MVANFARLRPGMVGRDTDYVAVESASHKTARPILTICAERGGAIVYGVNSNLCKLLSDQDREQIVSTIRKMLEERK